MSLNKPTPLWIAAISGDISSVCSLTDRGFTINLTEYLYETTRHATIHYDKITQILINNDKKNNVIDYHAFNFACWNGYSEIVKFFLDAGADITTIRSTMLIVISKHHINTLRLLLDAGIPKEYLLSIVVDKDEYEIAEILICEYSVHVNYIDTSFKTPIMYASSERMICLLVEYGADMYIEDGFGKNVVESSLLKQNLNLFYILVSFGAETPPENLQEFLNKDDEKNFCENPMLFLRIAKRFSEKMFKRYCERLARMLNTSVDVVCCLFL